MPIFCGKNDMKLVGQTQISRLLAFFGDFALASLAYHALARLELWSGLINVLGLLLEGSFERELLAQYLFFHALRFYSFLLLGTTPFYTLLGLKVVGGVIETRLKLSLRAVLDPLVTMLFPLNWTAFWTPQSFKGPECTWLERRLDVSFMQRPEGVIQSVSSFLVFPLFFLSLYAPLLSHWDWIGGVTMSEEVIELEQKEAFLSSRLISSKRFKMTWLLEMDQETFQFWPDFEFIRQGTHLRLLPLVRIYHRDHQAWLEMKTVRTIDWKNLLAEAQKKTGPFQRELVSRNCQELSELLQESFELGPLKLFSHTLKYGPFVQAHLALRDAVLGFVEGLPGTQVDLVRLGKERLLRLRQERPPLAERSAEIVHTYFPLCSSDVQAFEITYQSALPEAQAYQDFLKTVLVTASFSDEYDLGLPIHEGEFHVFHFLDSITELTLADQERFEQGAITYINELKKNHPTPPKATLERLKMVVELIEGRGEMKFSKTFKDILSIPKDQK